MLFLFFLHGFAKLNRGVGGLSIFDALQHVRRAVESRVFRPGSLSPLGFFE